MISLIIAAYFGSCRSQQIIKESAGIAVSELDDIDIYAGHVPVFWTWVISSPCTDIDKKLAYNIRGCDVKQDRYVRSANNLISKCNAIWLSEIQQLNNTLNSRNRARKPRQAGELILGAGLFANLFFGFKNAHDINHLASEFNEFKTAETKFIQETRDGQLKIASLIKKNRKDMIEFSRSVCIHENENDIRILESQVYLLLHNYVAGLESDLISVSFGNLPANLKLLSEVVDMCVHAQLLKRNSNKHRSFCHNLLTNKGYKIKFNGLGIKGDSLNLFMGIEIPLLSSDIHQASLFSISNVGFYKDNDKYYLQTPLNLIKIGDNADNILSINTQYCTGLVCPLSAIQFDISTVCIEQIILGSNMTSCIAHKEVDPYCDVKSFKEGTLISGANAVFMPDGNDIDPINIGYNSIYVNASGKLLCQFGKYSSTVMIEQPLLKTKINREIINLGLPGFDQTISYITPIQDLNVSLNEISSHHIILPNRSVFPVSYILCIILFLIILFGYFYYFRISIANAIRNCIHKNNTTLNLLGQNTEAHVSLENMLSTEP